MRTAATTDRPIAALWWMRMNQISATPTRHAARLGPLTFERHTLPQGADSLRYDPRKRGPSTLFAALFRFFFGVPVAEEFGIALKGPVLLAPLVEAAIAP